MSARPLLLLCFGILAACLPLMIWGAQTGHDHQFQLVRAEAFSDQLLGGELYPRWLLEMNAGAGGPTFFFYPPVAFYLSSIGFALAPGASPVVQLAIGEFLIILLSGLAFFWFARSFASPLVAAGTALLYALGPYHFGIDLLERQAIAEAASFIWIPLAFGFLERIVEGRRGLAGYAVAYALLTLTHLPTALLASILLLVYFMARRPPRREWIRFAGGTALGLLLAAIYLLPALTTQDRISMSGMWEGWFRYDRWFLLDGVEAPDGAFETRLRWVLLALWAGFLLAIPFAWRTGPRARAWLAVVAVASLLMTSISAWIWSWSPILHRVQFPWRMLALLEFAVLATLALGLRHRLARGAALILAVAAVVAAVTGYRPHLNAHADPGHRRELARIRENSMDQVELYSTKFIRVSSVNSLKSSKKRSAPR